MERKPRSRFLGLIGIMALRLGVMLLAERAGLVQKIARGLRPIMRRLFPDVPPEYPAMGLMVTNISANMLALGNAVPRRPAALAEQTYAPDDDAVAITLPLPSITPTTAPTGSRSWRDFRPNNCASRTSRFTPRSSTTTRTRPRSPIN